MGSFFEYLRVLSYTVLNVLCGRRGEEVLQEPLIYRILCELFSIGQIGNKEAAVSQTLHVSVELFDIERDEGLFLVHVSQRYPFSRISPENLS